MSDGWEGFDRVSADIADLEAELATATTVITAARVYVNLAVRNRDAVRVNTPEFRDLVRALAAREGDEGMWDTEDIYWDYRELAGLGVWEEPSHNAPTASQPNAPSNDTPS